ncbi:unnamed protein product [Urochloa decumbens]|uniref:F-box domain-containing protein n=1 Tax=Urochloa decumbens TaxID=240449 RepID=A0ABC8Y2S4_9POAL
MELPTLPSDPLLEIITRFDDVETVVRCAAICKPLRRAILDPDLFPRRLASSAAANGGFDPDLLLSVTYWPLAVNSIHSGEHFPADAFEQTASSRVRFDADLLLSYQLLSSRDGLLVLGRNHEAPDDAQMSASDIELLVCNTITGHVTSVPRLNHRGASGAFRSGIHPPVLLSTGGGGRSFELLVMYKGDYFLSVSREIQIFSSRKSEWGAARWIHKPPRMELARAASTVPAVVGRTVHWLACKDNAEQVKFRGGDLLILALHAEEAQEATVIKLPQGLLTSLTTSTEWEHSLAHNLILAATAEGKRLSIVAAENLAISVWTLLPEEHQQGSSISWSREVVIRRGQIGRQLALFPLDAYQPIRFSAFGERSGTVLFWMREVGLVQLNLGTKKILVIWKGRNHNYLRSKAFLHEAHLVSLLQSMKPF